MLRQMVDEGAQPGGDGLRRRADEMDRLARLRPVRQHADQTPGGDVGARDESRKCGNPGSRHHRIADREMRAKAQGRLMGQGDFLAALLQRQAARPRRCKA